MKLASPKCPAMPTSSKPNSGIVTLVTIEGKAIFNMSWLIVLSIGHKITQINAHTCCELSKNK